MLHGTVFVKSRTPSLHPRNPHQGRYDLEALCLSSPTLRSYLKSNPKRETTIDFSDSKAVLQLNKALLAHYYKIANWKIPEGYLCPPIPGRADYIHYIADLLTSADHPEVPTGRNTQVLDIGTGANCIYPIIGSQSYGWKFVATDIDPVAVKVAEVIVQSNPRLRKLVKLRLQKNPDAVFKGIIKPSDHFELTMCNPPFHASLAEAKAANQRKRSNLNQRKTARHGNDLNFGGQNAELWCADGEIGFLTRMAKESVDYSRQVYCFTSLVSKRENVAPLKKLLSRLGAQKIDVINMSQGQKVSRLLTWRFF